MRRSHKILVSAVVGLGAVVAWFVPPQVRYLRAACGYAAKVACSAVFVGGRELGSVLREELAQFDVLDVRVDRNERRVTASAFGIVSATARHRDGLGATLLVGSDEALMPASIDPPSASDDEWKVAFDAKLFTRIDPVLDGAFREEHPGLLRRTRAVAIVHGGELVAERYAEGFDAGRAQHGWSMSKTALASLLGVLVADGRLDLDAPAPVAALRTGTDEHRAITVDQLLRMESGLTFGEDYSDADSDAMQMLFGSADMGNYAAECPIEAPPDTQWRYSSGTSLILSRMLREIVGDEAVTTFARDRLFTPLGMSTARIEFDPSGTPVGSSYVWASPRDWARLGQMWLQDGVWHGRRILAEGFVQRATTPTPHAEGRFGAHVWLNAPDATGVRVWPQVPEDAFWAAGFDGQYLVVVPSRDAVIVRLGQTPDRRAFDMGVFVADVLAALAPN